MKKNTPLSRISIVTVVYNDKHNIENTIESVINQSYSNLEYIIIDGGSTDGTIEVIEKYRSKIAHFTSEADRGIYDAMNKGIAAATGDWINFMNSGDSFYNTDVLTNLFQREPSADLIYGKNFCKYSYFERANSPLPADKIKYGMIFSHQSMLVKTHLMRAQNFDLNYKISADFDFIYKLFKLGYKLEERQLIISTVIAGGVSEINLIHTHLERKKIALQYEQGLSKLFLAWHYNFVSAKILVTKFIKLILPNSIVQKITVLKHQ